MSLSLIICQMILHTNLVSTERPSDAGECGELVEHDKTAPQRNRKKPEHSFGVMNQRRKNGLAHVPGHLITVHLHDGVLHLDLLESAHHCVDRCVFDFGYCLLRVALRRTTKAGKRAASPMSFAAAISVPGNCPLPRHPALSSTHHEDCDVGIFFFLPTNAAERVYKGGGAGWWVDERAAAVLRRCSTELATVPGHLAEMVFLCVVCVCVCGVCGWCMGGEACV